MIDFPGLWFRAVSPRNGFQRLAARELRMGNSLGQLLLLRSPIAFLEGILLYFSFQGLYQGFTSMKGPLWSLILQQLPAEMSAEDIYSALQQCPPMPSLHHAWPWLLAAAPIYVASIWLHDAAWDHGCLWILGGLRKEGRVWATLLAESEALQVGVFGAAAGLMTSVPRIGWILSLPVGLIGVYFWVLRGFSLAAFHGCPLWKGITATILHAILAVCCISAFLVLFFILLAQVAG